MLNLLEGEVGSDVVVGMGGDEGGVRYGWFFGDVGLTIFLRRSMGRVLRKVGNDFWSGMRIIKVY